MDMPKERLVDVVAKLKRERDELRLRLHLATMEARDEWKELEGKWQAMESRLADAKEETAQKARDARGKAALIASELEAAYRRIREGLKTD